MKHRIVVILTGRNKRTVKASWSLSIRDVATQKLLTAPLSLNSLRDRMERWDIYDGTSREEKKKKRIIESGQQ